MLNGEVFTFSLPQEKAKFCPHLKYGMDTELFKQKTQDLLRYSERADRHILKVQIKPCEDCGTEVKNRRVECVPYRLGTPNEYFKHVCKPCNFVLFDGSLVKQPHKQPDKPMAVSGCELRKGRSRSRAISTPEGEFTSLTIAALHYKKSPSTILYMMRKQPKEFYYL